MEHYERMTTGQLRWSNTRKEIDQLLEKLDIVNKTKNTLVGDIFRRGLSLGERRRSELGTMVLAASETVG